MSDLNTPHPEWFGEAARLLLPGEPIFNDEFTEFGKWMDGWESRR
ncbi:unnamed protein product, partial [Ectocarpus sp. 13 AM-2016]